MVGSPLVEGDQSIASPSLSEIEACVPEAHQTQTLPAPHSETPAGISLNDHQGIQIDHVRRPFSPRASSVQAFAAMPKAALHFGRYLIDTLTYPWEEDRVMNDVRSEPGCQP